MVFFLSCLFRYGTPEAANGTADEDGASFVPPRY
jgi:hypothetical protein